MNARFGLLVLVTALFMMAWDGDQASMQAALARRDAKQQAMRLALNDVDAQPSQLVKADEPPSSDAPQSSQTVSHSETQVQADTDTAELPPLPAGIAAGKYQAVSQSGKSIELNVTAEQATSDIAEDLYFSRDPSDGSRWYLIRISAK